MVHKHRMKGEGGKIKVVVENSNVAELIISHSLTAISSYLSGQFKCMDTCTHISHAARGSGGTAGRLLIKGLVVRSMALCRRALGSDNEPRVAANASISVNVRGKVLKVKKSLI